MAATTVGTPADVGQRLLHRLRAAGRQRARLAGAALLVEAGGHGAQVRLEALPGRPSCPPPGGRSRRGARRCRRRGGRWWRSPAPRAGRRWSSSRRTSSSIAWRRSAGTVSMWLSTTSMTPAWVAERREVAVVDRRVGVLLRVEHPHQQVGELHDPVDLEVVGDLGGVVVGQVEQDHALHLVGPRRRPVSSPEVSSIESRVVWWRGGMPSHSSSSCGTLGAPDAGRGPRRGRAAYADRGQLQAGQRVERRRLARSGRARDRDDGVVRREPEPAGRALDDLLGLGRRPRRRAGPGPPRSPTWSASIRAPRSEPRVTSLRAPSSKDVIVSLGVRGRLAGRLGGPVGPRLRSEAVAIRAYRAAVPGVPGVLHPA